MAYIGNTPADKFQTLQKQSFTTSATDTYTLSYAVTNPQDLALFINNVRQNPNDAYSVSNTTLTLSSSISGSDTMYAVFLGRAVETVAPAIGSVTLGMLSASGTKDSSTFLRGDNTFAEAGGGKIGQVIQTVKTDTFTTTAQANSPVDITGLSASITPTATSSKILVMVNIGFISHSVGSTTSFFIKRGSTFIGIGDSAGSRPRATFGTGENGVTYVGKALSTAYLDSPSTVASTTYSVAVGGEGINVYINRASSDPDGANAGGRYISSIILQEVLA